MRCGSCSGRPPGSLRRRASRPGARSPASAARPPALRSEQPALAPDRRVELEEPAAVARRLRTARHGVDGRVLGVSTATPMVFAAPSSTVAALASGNVATLTGGRARRPPTARGRSGSREPRRSRSSGVPAAAPTPEGDVRGWRLGAAQGVRPGNRHACGRVRDRRWRDVGAHHRRRHRLRRRGQASHPRRPPRQHSGPMSEASPAVARHSPARARTSPRTTPSRDALQHPRCAQHPPAGRGVGCGVHAEQLDGGRRGGALRRSGVSGSLTVGAV